MKLTLWRLHKDKMTRKRDRTASPLSQDAPGDHSDTEDSDDEEAIPDAKKGPSTFIRHLAPSATYMVGHSLTPRNFTVRDTQLTLSSMARIESDESGSETGSAEKPIGKVSRGEDSEKLSSESSEDTEKKPTKKDKKKSRTSSHSSEKIDSEGSSEKSNKSKSKKSSESESVDKKSKSDALSGSEANTQISLDTEVSGYGSAEEW